MRLPPDAGLAVSELATEAPAGVTFYVAENGRLLRIDSGHEQTIMIRFHLTV
ncbi:MAG: hypothetical protein WCD20_05505 [Rhodomicrobium sp.]